MTTTGTKKKRRPGRPAKKAYSFDLARRDYLQDSELSLNQVADRYEIPRVSLARRARKESWQELRGDAGPKTEPAPQAFVVLDEEAFFENDEWF